MAFFGSRKGAAQALSVILMVASFVVIAGFLAWLNIQAAETEVAVVEDASGAEDSLGGAPVVDVAVFGPDPMAHTDGVIRINNLTAQSAVGTQAFFVDVGQPIPFLIRMGDRVAADGVLVPTGSTVSVVGQVYAMSDSVADGWVAAGTLAEDDRILATIGSSYMEIVDIVVMATDGGGDN
jgi:hypothetical protein